ncbi:MAG: hypothetical protein IT425_05420 [Pirellulales bacterium]|nr:hypothetical protein [Pirellulales bacterium]
MATQTESVTGFFDQVFGNIRKASEANVELQQELFRKWSEHWPGVPQVQGGYAERVQKFQKDWTKTVKSLLNRHREVLDEEYGLAIDSLEEAFWLAQSADPQEYAKRCESLCRKSLDVMREAGEMQVKELQDAFNKMSELMTKSVS